LLLKKPEMPLLYKFFILKINASYSKRSSVIINFNFFED
jgi:hypothetical protein